MTEALPARVTAFAFGGWRYAPHAGRLELRYRLEPVADLTETIHFDQATFRPAPRALWHRFRLLHLLAGISYYKAACPPRLRVPFVVPPALLAFVRSVYEQGLAEFAHANGVDDLGERLRFEVDEGAVAEPVSPAHAGGGDVVVPLGGGKDSLVAVDCLERAGVAFRTIAVGSAPRLDLVARAVGREHLRIRRTLDPRLFALNEQGALNGHVPITAILAAIMSCAGAFYGFDTIVLANERSADAPTRLLADGRAVNHQFSKTLAFERAFQAVLATEAPGLRYFSLLRPWSELAITRRFASLRRFHDVFSSCNGNFRLRGSEGARWCGSCPKCRFVFLALAPFLPASELVAIFGRNLLAEPEQLPGFAVLVGLDGDKPFECVGEIGESRAALAQLATQPSWRAAPVVAALAPRLPPAPLEPWLVPSEEHAVPPDFVDAALAFVGRP